MPDYLVTLQQAKGGGMVQLAPARGVIENEKRVATTHSENSENPYELSQPESCTAGTS